MPSIRPVSPTDNEREQEESVAFLASQAAHAGARVARISTHGAHVFLAGARAYKLKRAVRYSFMDFSTLEKRRATLETELALNREHAPQLYLGLQAIHRSPDGRIGWEEGEIIDWVLVMSRFEQSDLLSERARAGHLTRSDLETLAHTVALMHKTAPIVHRAEADFFTSVALDNFEPLAESGFTFEALPAARLALEPALAAARPWLTARARDGFVRRSHGDLHLGNLVMLNGRPTPFDALEFNADLATGDVYYDLAYLLMDLDQNHLRSSANLVLSRYAAYSDDLAGLAGLPLFLATRALVRAKVLTYQGNPQSAAPLVEAVTEYLRPYRPCLIAIGGLSGTGKSTVAEALAPDVGPSPGAVVLRSDVLRKILFDVPTSTRLSAEAYTTASTDRVYKVLLDQAARVLAAGRSVIVDAVCAQAEQREALRRCAQDAPLHGIWLEAPLVDRVARVGGRVDDASDADRKVVEAQEAYDVGFVGWHKVDARGAPQDVLGRVRRALA